MTRLTLSFEAPAPVVLTDGPSLSLAFPAPQAVTLQVQGIQGPPGSGGGGGGVTDGDKGDITVSGTGTVWTVDTSAITLSKMADLATSTILGRATAGTGVPEALTAAQVRTILNVANGATANSADATLLARANHTGTQAAATITGLATIATSGSASDLSAGTLPAARFDDTAHGARSGGTLHANVVAAGAAGFMTGADKTKLDAITGTNTGDQTITLTGDVTGSGTGSFAATIAAGAVSLSKMANLAASTIIGNNTGSPATPIALTTAQVKTLLAIAAGDVSGLATVATSGSASDLGAGTLPAARLPAFGSGDVSFAAGGGAGTIAAGAVTLAKQANMATASVVYRKTAGSGAPEVQTLATLKTDLGLTGTNSGDQTITLTSDVTGSGTGSFAATIAADAVTNAKLANMATATFKGRTTAGTGDPEDLTATQATALLDLATTSVKGLLPARSGVATQYLDGTGAWSVPAGGGGGVSDGDKGDITVSSGATVWTVDNDVVTNAKLANVATATIKGRVTAATGDPEDLTGTQATTLLDTFTSALKGLAPASGGGTTNFLRADGTWAAAGGGSPITLQDEGANITTALATLNVVGLGAVASGTSSATLTINGLVTAAPATDQADWAPSGLGAGTGTIKAQPTTNSFLTGLTAGATDQTVTIWNDSAFVICLERESGASTAANRFSFISLGSLWLLPNQSVSLRYSATSSRWVVTSQSRDVFGLGPRMSLTLPGSGTAIQAMGGPAIGTTATISNANASSTPTNDFTEVCNFQISNSTAAGTSSVRHANQLAFLRGATTGRQGFFHAGSVRFTAMGATSGAVRSGMTSSNAALTTLNNALTQCLLIGAQTADTNLRIYSGDAAAGTPVNLGANFPTPSATAAYEYCFYCPSNTAVVRYMVRRLDSRFVAEGTLTTNIPTTTTPLGHRLEIMVGATAVANTAQAAYLLTMGL
jgi:hypothetical protein